MRFIKLFILLGLAFASFQGRGAGELEGGRRPSSSSTLSVGPAADKGTSISPRARRRLSSGGEAIVTSKMPKSPRLRRRSQMSDDSGENAGAAAAASKSGFLKGRRRSRTEAPPLPKGKGERGRAQTNPEAALDPFFPTPQRRVSLGGGLTRPMWLPSDVSGSRASFDESEEGPVLVVSGGEDSRRKSGQRDMSTQTSGDEWEIDSEGRRDSVSSVSSVFSGPSEQSSPVRPMRRSGGGAATPSRDHRMPPAAPSPARGARGSNGSVVSGEEGEGDFGFPPDLLSDDENSDTEDENSDTETRITTV